MRRGSRSADTVQNQMVLMFYFLLRAVISNEYLLNFLSVITVHKLYTLHMLSQFTGLATPSSRHE